MKVLTKLAWRNIYRNKRRTVLTISMMTLGYVLFSFFISLADGAYNDIIEKFIRERTGNIQIHRQGYLDNPRLNQTIKDYNKIISKHIHPHKLSYSLRVKSGALAFGEKKSMGVEVIGLEPQLESKITTLKDRVNVGEYLSIDQVVIGKKVAEVLKLKLKDQLVLISQAADGSIANDVFMIGGIIRPDSGSESFDDRVVYMPLIMAQHFYALDEKVHEIVLKSKTDERLLAKQLNDALPDGLKASTWQEVEKEFYRAMQVDRKGDLIGRMIFMLVVVIGVLNTILMSILERKKEFAVLKALGTRPNNIFFLITLETLIMAVISVTVGAILALIINGYFSVVGIEFTPFEYGGMRFDKMVATLNMRSFVIPGLTIIGSAVFVSMFPAYMAAKVIPFEAMRKL
jgi:putative ABC transport system permease protein